MTTLPDPLPLFPLPETVLFPGQVLPLYVFEDRYRALLERVQASGEPFGIVRIARGEQPFGERLSPVGTLAHLTHVARHEDGSSSIVVVGGERFLRGELDHRWPYHSARAQLWPLAQGDEQAEAEAAAQLLAGLLRCWPEPMAALQAQLPTAPLLIGSFAASLLCSLAPTQSAAARDEALAATTLSRRLSLLLSALPWQVPEHGLN